MSKYLYLSIYPLSIYLHLCVICQSTYSDTYINIHAYHTCIAYTYIFLNGICSVFIILLMLCFQGYHLQLECQLVCSYLRITTFPTLSFLHLLIVLFVGLRSDELFPIYFGIFIGITFVQLIFGKSCW